MRHRQRLAHARLMGSAAFVALALAAGGAQAQTKPITIAPQPLETALNELAFHSGEQVLIRSDVTTGKLTRGVSKAPTFELALVEMLQGTGLTYRREGDVFMVVKSGESGGPQGESAAGGGAEVEALIVTAQKKEEAIQDVPIAISAFTQKSLDAQKIEGGFDLLKAIPNVTFSKTNFSGYNFQIRGIGTQAVSATTDPGVAVSFNNTTLIVNRLFEQEYVDVERVEVLRGPQGTLYGRNATAGVINVISAKPRMGEFLGEVKLEAGNFNAQRVRGHVNVPIGDTMAIRGAFAATKRDGYGKNLAATDPDRLYGDEVSEDVDGRNLWTGRVTLGWEPTDYLRVNLMWERFKEDDNRVRTSKQLCTRDTGPSFITETRPVSNYTDASLSQGCKAGSLYADEAFGTPNGASLPYVQAHYTALATGRVYGLFLNLPEVFGLGGSEWSVARWADPNTPPEGLPCEEVAYAGFVYTVDLCNPDVYRGQVQSKDLREIYSVLEPIYRADSDIVELSVDYDLGEAVFTSQTVYAKDDYYATQDYNRFTSFPIWSDSAQACNLQNFFGSFFFDCSDNPDTGRGTFAPLTDADGDGIIDQNHKALGDYVVDSGGFVRDASGQRVGFYRDLAPGGVVCDPQLGCSDSLVVQDLSQAESVQFNQEFRLVSNYDGPFNFSIGANYTHFETTNDYYVFSNALTYLLSLWPFDNHTSPCATQGLMCRYVDPNPLASINGEGHNYFRSSNPYELNSAAIFGEGYWDITSELGLTAGVRLTWDRKVFTPVASQLLLADYRHLALADPDSLALTLGNPGLGDGPEACTNPVYCGILGTAVDGRGAVASPDIVQEWREPTGRIVLDWKPDLGLSWLDETMLYASASRGYKGGGANPPSIAPPARQVFDQASGGTSDTFKAEYVNAFEVGSKNTLFGGMMTLNMNGFYYDYTDYQVSRIIDRRAVNDNFDATIWGLEMEGVFSPARNLRFNWALGYLNTRIADGERSIDIMDRAAGGNLFFANPDGDFPEGFDEWVVVQPFITAAANCVVPRSIIEADYLLGGDTSAATIVFPPLWSKYCPSGSAVGPAAVQNAPYLDEAGNPVTTGRTYFYADDAPNGGIGFYKDLGGNRLPNAPEFTVSFGAQYTMGLPGGWDATLRGDFYWQDESFARVYNMTDYDRLRAWTNTNISLWVENPDWGVKAEVYVKNAFDETPITGTFLNSEDSGLTTNVFTLDPRLVGVSVTKSF